MSVLGVKGSGWLCKFPRLINHNIVTLNIIGQCTKKCSGRVTTQGIMVTSQLADGPTHRRQLADL